MATRTDLLLILMIIECEHTDEVECSRPIGGYTAGTPHELCFEHSTFDKFLEELFEIFQNKGSPRKIYTIATYVRLTSNASKLILSLDKFGFLRFYIE